MKLCKKLLNKRFTIPKPRIIMKRSVVEFIKETTLKSPFVETGGILMGYDKKDLLVEVISASLPGPNAYHSSTKFERDTIYCTRVLYENYYKHGIDYVGEWHSHVVPLRRASIGDIDTIASIVLDPDYSFNAFACIVALLEHNKVELLGYIADEKYIYSH
ncbi:MAG: hypothetical protein SCJ93_11190 [Bacillota bacterium]|nr:hypothetical protein [Bacillota bacterium]